MQNGPGKIGIALVMVLSAATVVHGARQQNTKPTPTYSAAPAETSDATLMKMHEQQASAADTERHRRMVADSDKLLQLATELKVEVDKSTRNEMSVAAIKKAADIERLAHDVKERMKGN